MQLKVGSAVFDESNIRSLQMNQKSTLVVPELEPDAITAVVEDRSTVVQPLATSSMLLAADGIIMASKLHDRAVDQYKYGQKISATLGGVTTQMNVENIRRVAKHLYQIDGISDIGLLMNGTYYGGIYDGITFGELAAEIINGIFSYTVDTALTAMPMYGWLPKSTRRDALHSVLFAAGAIIRKTADGAVQISAQTEQTPYSLENIYLGGSVEDIPPATKVSVVEHSFSALPTDEVVTLFDGEVAAEDIVTPNGQRAHGVIVEFTEPIHDLVINNGTIIESGANYAVLSQSPAAQLTGQRYTHTRRTLQHVLGNGGQPNEYTADECGLVNLMNAENVLSRLVAYYGATKQYPIDFVYNGQKPGDAVTFTDPFGDAATGYIESLDIVGSHTNKASARITEGYIPASSGNYYSKYAVLTEDGMFTVPAECKGKIKVVLIGGGMGGYAGENGGDGQSSTAAGEGGNGGQGGSGAKIYVATLAAKAGQTFAYTIGEGGDGAESGAEPQAGGDTVFGGYSTADGFTAANGYPLLLLDEVVGLSGDAGARGGNGGTNGSGEDIEYNGVTYKGGIRPDAVIQPEFGYAAPSGNGGGAAVGNNGGDGSRGYIETVLYEGQYITWVNGGKGGNGADATAREAVTGIGRGGFGGHGGGGGGTGASGTSALGTGAGGKGGLGGQGGRGSDGAVIIYY